MSKSNLECYFVFVSWSQLYSDMKLVLVLVKDDIWVKCHKLINVQVRFVNLSNFDSSDSGTQLCLLGLVAR